MRTILTCGLYLLAITLVSAQAVKKTMEAYRTDEPIKIDGVLDERAWAEADRGEDFITRRPDPGLPATQHSSISILYSDLGLYVGARLYDTAPDSIQAELTDRDNLGNTDFFGVIVDPYQSGFNGFEFLMTPGNVQFDAQAIPDGEDQNWDAVWESKAEITPDGWVAEIFIPFSALRFPKTAVQTWDLNFVRMVRRTQEQSFWSEIKPEVDGFMNQAGKLLGIQNIKAPFRLQLTPFATAAGAVAVQPGQEEKYTSGSTLGGGLDLKLGLSDAFTLDMTLIPDFSEARSDDNILNLGPFEQRFDEQRAFFTEGTELFNKGGFFYSRRVGGRIHNLGAAYNDLTANEEVVSAPVRSKLLNATKISGRTAKGMGIGFFNAVEGRSFATINNLENGEQRQVEVNPLTNYNVMVVDQNLPNNSSITLINTNVLRDGNATDANVTGLVFDLHNKANKYALRGTGGLSQRFVDGENNVGHRASLRFEKISGAWQYMLGYSEESDTYNPNDLGLLFNNNERTFNGRLNYNRFKPFLNGAFNSGGAGMYVEQGRLYADNKFAGHNVEVWVYATTKGFWNLNFWSDNNPGTQYDYFEPRVAGRVLQVSSSSNLGGWVGTDNRKKLSFGVNFNLDRYWQDELRKENRFNINANYRASDRLSLSTYLYRGFFNGDLGYVNSQTYSVIDPGVEKPREVTDVFIGRRDNNEMEVGLEGKYSFSANMSLNLRARHYWARVNYSDFHLLKEQGTLGQTDYSENHNVDFDAFNIDLIYRWRFAPGSDIFVVYKTSATDFRDETRNDYGGNFRQLWQEGPSNHSLSLKVVYWLDYASLVK